MSLDLSVIILTYNEELHIRRCIENARRVAREIFVIDSFSTDRTVEIAKEYDNVQVLQNRWELSYAKQFNWGLEHTPIRTEWVLRLDADEYLTDELINELRERIPQMGEEQTGGIFSLRVVFMGRWMRRGIPTVRLLRLFRYGKAICENRQMDEHIQLLEGHAIDFQGAFYDHNLQDIGWWTTKHNGYAIREAADLLNVELGIFEQDTAQHPSSRLPTESIGVSQGKGSTSCDTVNAEQSHLSAQAAHLSAQAAAKRAKKLKYAKMPLFWRAFAYFVLRYFVRLGFLEGVPGFLWHFLQGWWYRTLVDAKIWQIKQACGNDKAKIVAYLKERGISI